MDYEITGGIRSDAQKVVIYGPEGVGKSSFASRFPDPVFIDTEGSTKRMDVRRLPRPTSWAMLLDQVGFVRTKRPCSSLVIDTIDWAEQLCTGAVCAKHGKSGIEDFGYGNGYVYVKEEFGRFLNRLSDVIEAGINVVLTAHAQIRKFEQPDEMGAYDRYELKLGKKTQSQTSPLVKEWADMLLFANYKTYSVAADDKGKKHKAQGGKRVMYTSHHPCWDAKNRHGLPGEMDFNYEGIMRHIPDLVGGAGIPAEPKPQPEPQQQPEPKSSDMEPKPESPDRKPEPEPLTGQKPPAKEEPAGPANTGAGDRPIRQLYDLMDRFEVSREEIQWAVSEKGYYPKDTPIENYAEDFVAGVLVAAWNQVNGMIIDERIKGIPF